MTKILIINYNNRLDKGGSAILNSKIESLRKYIPDAEFTVFTRFPEIEYDQYNLKMFSSISVLPSFSLPMTLMGIFFIIFTPLWRVLYKYVGETVNISIKAKRLKDYIDNTKMIKISIKNSLITSFFMLRCSLWAVLHKYLHLNANILINEERLQEYYNADLIINIGGDGLTDICPPMYFTSNLLFGILLDKPIILYGEAVSMKPFKGSFGKKRNAFITKFTLNRASLITLREEPSNMCLRELGINKPPIYTTADSAFLLKPASKGTISKIVIKEKIGTNKPIVGMSVSKFATGFSSTSRSPEEIYSNYVTVLAKVSDYLIDKLGATVVFIPHNIEPIVDDRITANEMYNEIKHKQNVILINNEYTPEELKGVIGVCDLFIGTRLHALIASTSMCVPTITIAYGGHKIRGIIGEMLGQEEYVMDIGELDYDTLISKINDAWNNRDKIKKDLESKIEIVKERALLNAKLVKEILDTSKASHK